jgi:hypothetical protein
VASDGAVEFSKEASMFVRFVLPPSLVFLLGVALFANAHSIRTAATGRLQPTTINDSAADAAAIRAHIESWPPSRDGQDQSKDALFYELQTHQYDLQTTGRNFLLNEARNASFFLLGEMHGENEIPALLHMLWPSMWDNGYRYVAAELSSWAAQQLEFPNKITPPRGGFGLWRQSEADFITGLKKNSKPVIWGCDIEEVRPHALIGQLSLKNPANQPLRSMAELTREGYQRSRADELLVLAQRASNASELNNESKKLLHLIVATLDVESDRAHDERLRASVKREVVMKRNFLEHYLHAKIGQKVLARFGSNHLYRGIDRRGVSTLGNFIAEFALAHGESTFHLATFCAGGRIRLGGTTSACDDTKEDLGLALLGSEARYAETVFDLRVIRQTLHRIPEGTRSAAETSLIYWADSYDAVICYRQVTPLS